MFEQVDRSGLCVVFEQVGHTVSVAHEVVQSSIIGLLIVV
jgi:hypothetical protein